MSLALEQCFGHTLSNGTYVPCYGTQTQRAVLTATGGQTVFLNQSGAGTGQSFYDWRMFAGQFGLVAWGGSNNGGGSSCTTPSSITPAPYYATIGSSGDLATCTLSMIPSGGTFSQTLRWSVTASDRPGMALVCLATFCFRTDENGNVDTSKFPWAPE